MTVTTLTCDNCGITRILANRPMNGKSMTAWWEEDAKRLCASCRAISPQAIAKTRKRLDAEEAQKATEVAIAQVEEHANPDWLTRARDTVLLVADKLDEFTTDDVWEHLDREGQPEPRALGAVMVRLAREKQIAATDRYRKSIRRACHSNPKRVWVKA